LDIVVHLFDICVRGVIDYNMEIIVLVSSDIVKGASSSIDLLRHLFGTTNHEDKENATHLIMANLGEVVAV
jgi:hypothetical protein